MSEPSDIPSAPPMESEVPEAPPLEAPVLEMKISAPSLDELTLLIITKLQSRPDMQDIIREYQVRKKFHVNKDAALHRLAALRQQLLETERSRSKLNADRLEQLGSTRKLRINAFKAAAEELSLKTKEFKSGSPMTYRGDGRCPWVILMSGFYARTGGSGPRLAASTLQKVALTQGHIESWMHTWRMKQQSDGVDIISTGPGGAKGESLGGSQSDWMYAISLDGLGEYTVNAQTLGIDKYAYPAGKSGDQMAKTPDTLLLDSDSLETATEIAIKAHGGVGEISFLTNIKPARIVAFTMISDDRDIGWIEFSKEKIDAYRELLIEYGLHEFTR